MKKEKKVMNEEAPGVQKVVPKRIVDGIEKISIENGVHTVMLDIRVIRQNAIADFLKEQHKRDRQHTRSALNEDIALAIGHFDVPIDMIYDGSGMSELYLSDECLGMIVRHRMKREKEPN